MRAAGVLVLIAKHLPLFFKELSAYFTHEHGPLSSRNIFDTIRIIVILF